MFKYIVFPNVQETCGQTTHGKVFKIKGVHISEMFTSKSCSDIKVSKWDNDVQETYRQHTHGYNSVQNKRCSQLRNIRLSEMYRFIGLDDVQMT